ncbi:O-antigen/teichoic acid export membrane protein [Limimaricola variabilis]|uniref:O-antigen/teichoic acid export membrane protein n=1 Tax=Limimaricola variabilis TaxID=1492771 RepID=A0ABR6HJU6_9RHOB|nr:O-antigen/teichoic acid export membrane protein [Limimaricola variabilis]
MTIGRSLLLSLVDKSLGTLMSVGMMVVVSRLLSPAEIGLFLVSSAAVILIETFRDFGVASSIIKEPSLTPDFLRSASTIVALLSLGLGLGLYLGAGAIAALYGAADLAPLLEVAALGFLFAPISSVRLALLRREMAFGRVAVIGLGANGVGTLTALGLAISGWGALSLAWGSVATACAAAILAQTFRPEPGLYRPTLAHWRRILPFGAWSCLVTILGLLTETLPRLIIGRILGFTAVGLLARAVSLTQLPDRLVLSAVQPVALPAFAELRRAKTELSKVYLGALSLVVILQWPALACLGILADPAVRLLLGDQWLAAIPLLQVVSLAGMALFPASLAFPILVAVEAIRDLAILNLIFVPLLAATIIMAAQFGLMALAWSLLPLNIVQGLALLAAVRRHLPFRWSELGWVIGRGLGIVGATILIPAAVMITWGPTPDARMTAIAVFGAVIGWLIGVSATDNLLAPRLNRLRTGRLKGPVRKLVTLVRQ